MCARQRGETKRAADRESHLESNLLPLENSFPVYGRDTVGQKLGLNYTHKAQIDVRRLRTHVMNLDRVTLVGFGRAVRGRVRRLDVQYFWWGLLRRHEQSEDKGG